MFRNCDILVVGARGIPDIEGGAEKHAEMAFPFLQEQGLSITLLALRGFVTKSDYRGIRLVGIPSLKFAQTDKLIYHAVCVLYAIFTRPKIVHLQGLNAALFLSLYRLFGLRVVLRYASADHLHQKWGLLGRLAFRVCELQVRFAHHVIAVSKTYQRELEERYGIKNITVIPNGVDPIKVSDESEAFFDQLDLDGLPFILSVGRLTVDKDFEAVIKAAEILSDPMPRVVIAGGVSEQTYADHLFQLSGDQVLFLGRIDRSLLASLYRRCAVFTNTSHFEGQSNALLEAISNGCPIIASDIEANRELNLPPISYFPVGDTKILCEKLTLALEQPELFVSPKEAYPTWDKVADQMRDLYLALLPSLAASIDKPRHAFEKVD